MFYLKCTSLKFPPLMFAERDGTNQGFLMLFVMKYSLFCAQELDKTNPRVISENSVCRTLEMTD